MPLVNAALVIAAALGLPELLANAAEARKAAERFAPKAALIELKATEEAGATELTWSYFDGDSDADKDFFVDVVVRDGAPRVRLNREPKRALRPTPLELAKAAVVWSKLRPPSSETFSKWEGFRLRPRADGVPCWRTRLKDGGPIYFDARTGEKSDACGEPWKNR